MKSNSPIIPSIKPKKPKRAIIRKIKPTPAEKPIDPISATEPVKRRKS